MKVGYARVSSTGQSLASQKDRLLQANCEKIYEEKRSGVDNQRPELKACLDFVREGDELVITKLDRLARSASHLNEIVEKLDQRKVQFIALDQHIDTGSSTGKLMLHMLAAFAEFENNLRKERQADGIKAAKKKGVKFGRRPKLTLEQKIEIIDLREAGHTVKQLMNQYNISKDSVYNVLKLKNELKNALTV